MPSVRKNHSMGSNIISSADSAIDARDSIRFSVEFLNKLTPAEILPHHHVIGKQLALMLLRKLTPKQELCTSTSLILIKATNILLYRMIF